MKIFGRKTGKHQLTKFARKIGHKADVIGRKTLHTIDKLAPIAEIALTSAGHPELAAGVAGIAQGAHLADSAIRSGVRVAAGKQANIGANSVRFGEDVAALKEHKNNLLL